MYFKDNRRNRKRRKRGRERDRKREWNIYIQIMSDITAQNRITLKSITSGNMKLTSSVWFYFWC